MKQESFHTLPQYIAALSASAGALATGSVLGWTSPTQREFMSGEYGFEVSNEQFSWVGAVANIGAAMACIPVGLLCQKFGHKPTMLFMVLPFTLGWLLLVFAKSVAMLIAGRFFVGMASSSFCVTVPMYVGEIASKEIRGVLGNFLQLMANIGILIVFVVGYGVNAFTLSIICGIIPIAFGAVFLFMPESPFHLVKRGEDKKAMKVIKWLRGSQYDAKQETMELSKEHEELMKIRDSSLWHAVKKPVSLKSIAIGLGLMFFAQTSGVNPVIYFTTDIFKDANTNIEPAISTIIIGAIQVVATVISTLLVDRLGRRILLLSSGFLMALSTLALGIYFYLKDQDVTKVTNVGWLPITSLCVFIVMFSLGFGPVPWLMIGELFSPDIKGFAAALAGTTGWLMAFIISKSFINLRDALGNGGTFWLFGGFTIVATVFVFMFVPETKGKSLAEIQDILSGKGSKSAQIAIESDTNESLAFEEEK